MDPTINRIRRIAMANLSTGPYKHDTARLIHMMDFVAKIGAEGLYMGGGTGLDDYLEHLAALCVSWRLTRDMAQTEKREEQDGSGADRRTVVHQVREGSV